jgi:DNA-binding transcriptional LysR family regulator
MDLDGIAAFVKVVQAGSFSLAARQLGIPNTTVSARVARLEKRLGVTLIQRTTRKLHVTPAGRAYFERCVRGLAEIQSAEAEVTHAAAEPQGLLRITAPGDVAHGLLPPLVARYLEMYPRTSVEIVVTNRIVDLVAEGVHLAIRASALGDSTLMARRFKSFKGGLWASRDYVQRRGAPKKPADLERHECVLFPRLREKGLPLTDGKRRLEIAVQGRLVADDMASLRKLAVQGIGIATLPDFLAEDGDGALVRVLPAWTWMTGALSFVYPGQRFVPANVRAFIDTALAFRSSSAD